MSDGKNGFSNSPEFDFTPIGQAIKNARETKEITREQLSEVIDYAPRHIQSIENECQHPSFGILPIRSQLEIYFEDRLAGRNL